ncbi:MAG: hypothetical protein U9R31_02085 [Candidatus Omnitrophota bacterium]|nr:hypothetical protein [Candidatus Omnitrophota bacterium]
MELNINKLLNSPIKMKICLFFHKNPSVIDTIRNIAIWINQSPEAAEKALGELVDDKVLLIHLTSSTKAYSYTQDTAITSKIEKLLKTIK